VIFICAICGKAITDADDSDEHIIPASIGGRRTVRSFLHRVCNNTTGHTWDAELERQLRPLALQFGVKRQRGQTLRMAITTTAGEHFLLGPDGQLAMAKPIIAKTPTAQGTTHQITVGSVDSARKALGGLKRKHPDIDIDAALASSQIQRSYPRGAIHLDIGFGGEQAGRSLVKSALALAHGAGLPIGLCTDAVGYLRGSAPPCFGYYFIGDLIVERPVAIPLHCIAIEANPDTGLVLGYGEYFGVHRAVLCLGRDYEGEAVRRVYALDPRKGAELDLAVHLPFNDADIAAIYDYQMDDAAGRQAAFGAVFAPVLQRRREAEWSLVAKEAFDYAWANCGATPNTMLTDKDKRAIVRLFADKAAPFLTRVVGLDQQAARHHAEVFARYILNSA